MHVPAIPERPTLRPPTGGPLLGKQVLVVAPDVGCDIKGIKQLWRTLRMYGVRVAAATETQGEVVGDDWRRLGPDLLLIEVDPAAWDVLVVAGGSGAATLAEDAYTRELVAAADRAGRIVAAFGGGVQVLARAGINGMVRQSADELALALLHVLARIRPPSVQPSP